MYREALAQGTQVVLFALVMTGADPLIKGDPGTIVYRPYPQGLFIANAHDKPVNVWAHDLRHSDWPGITNLAELRAALA